MNILYYDSIKRNKTSFHQGGSYMFYKNARIFTGEFKFETGAFEVKDGKFGTILP